MNYLIIKFLKVKVIFIVINILENIVVYEYDYLLWDKNFLLLLNIKKLWGK